MEILINKVVGSKQISLYAANLRCEQERHSPYTVLVHDFFDKSFGFRCLEFNNREEAEKQVEEFVNQFTPTKQPKHKTPKTFPKVGDKLYLQQGGKTYGCAAEVKEAYTVIAVTSKYVEVQECDYEWPEHRYYNTMPLKIKENPNGKTRKLYWSNKYGCWQDTYGGTMADYPLQAHFGSWQYYPYLD